MALLLGLALWLGLSAPAAPCEALFASELVGAPYGCRSDAGE